MIQEKNNVVLIKKDTKRQNKDFKAVIEDNRIIGILTARQCLGILKRANFSRKNINFNLKDAVIRDVPIFSDSDPISKLIDYTREYKVGGGLVIENNNLKGIVTERDILEKIII